MKSRNLGKHVDSKKKTNRKTGTDSDLSPSYTSFKSHQPSLGFVFALFCFGCMFSHMFIQKANNHLHVRRQLILYLQLNKK